jgi:poly[(R)-3-hydroxyalkanoate] polymerase subunit PhaC
MGLSSASPHPQMARATARYAWALIKNPTIAASEVLRWASEEAKILAGTSTVQAEPGDKRFADPAWQHPVWRRVAQHYLLARSTLVEPVGGLGLDAKSTARARFAVSRGRSFVDGGRHLLWDLRHNGGMPSQVDTRPFRVGETVALSPGAIVHRTPLFELIQYTPQTADVRVVPTVVVPPQINRYYFLDLAPGRSFVEHSVGSGIPTFMISWRNPDPCMRDLGLDA